MGCCGVQVSVTRDAGLVTQVGKQRRNAGTRLTGEEKKRFCRCAGRRQRAERLRLGDCLWSGRGGLNLAGRARGKDAGRYGKAAFERKKAWECSGQVREVDSSWGRGGGWLTGKGQGPLGGSGARAGPSVGAGPGPGPGGGQVCLGLLYSATKGAVGLAPPQWLPFQQPRLNPGNCSTFPQADPGAQAHGPAPVGLGPGSAW